MAPIENATSQQAAELLDSMGRLETELAAHRPLVVEANRRARIAKRLGVVGLAVGLVGIVVGIVGLNLAAKADEQIDSNRQAIEQVEALIVRIEQDRGEARASGCIQDNVLIDATRRSVTNGILALVPGAESPDDLTPEQRERYNAYAERVESQLPFRDCTEQGIDAYFENPPADPAIDGRLPHGA